MGKRNKEIEEVVKENIDVQSLDDLMSDRFSVYAKYVIQDRAIPDVRDGLKPVQRRIIYSMYTNGNTADKPTRKCAKIVGDVMGRFHPHGDSSIYDALTRLSQDWIMNVPLVDFQGNNGSIDNDPAAAYRYTEARLSKFAEVLVKNIDKKTIDWTLNFDDEEYEPLVLPSYVPNLFINGSKGIAVAIATDIPPHNLKEMCEATIFRIEHPNCDLEDVLEIVKGPDFPTGGIIYTGENFTDIYKTGRGKFDLCSNIIVEEESDKTLLKINEIPYGVIKQDLVFQIDSIRKNKTIDGILDVKDLSSGDNIDIIIEIKKNVDVNIIIQFLKSKTDLQISYNANIVAICDKHPETLTLLSYLDYYISHLFNVNKRQIGFDLDKAKLRLHIVEGLIKAIDIIDEIIKIIKNSADKDSSRTALMNAYGFSYDQAEAILNIRLYKLSHTDVSIYLNEKEELVAFINKYDAILNSEAKLRKYVINDLEENIKLFGKERKSKIEKASEKISLNKRDLISKEDVFVVITEEGYIKRSSIKSYKACEGQLPGLKDGDRIILSKLVNTLDYILAFTNLGNYLFIPVHEIVENRWKDEGKHINYLINLPLNEIIIGCISVSDFEKDISIALLSKNGQIKKTPLKTFFAQRYSKPIMCMKLLKDDQVVDFTICNNNSNLLVITSAGASSYFNENEISATGLKSSGVKAISTLRGSCANKLFAYNQDDKEDLFLLTDKGMYRVFSISKLTLTPRLGATQFIFKSFKSDQHNLVYACKLIDKKSPLVLNCLLSNKELKEFTFDDFHLTPVDKYCKANIEAFNFDNVYIKNVFLNDCQKINSDTFVDKKVIKNENIENDENKEEPLFEQISIFDDIDD